MKLIVTLTASVLLLFGAGQAHAASPEDCAESDTVPDGVECPIDGEYPIVAPEGGTVPDTTAPPTTIPAPTVPPRGLPATGADGSTTMLQLGGLFLVGGAVVLVVARRRQPVANAA